MTTLTIWWLAFQYWAAGAPWATAIETARDLVDARWEGRTIE